MFSDCQTLLCCSCYTLLLISKKLQTVSGEKDTNSQTGIEQKVTLTDITNSSIPCKVKIKWYLNFSANRPSVSRIQSDVLVFLNGYSSSYWPSVIFGGGDHSVVGGECFSNELCWVDLTFTKQLQKFLHIKLQHSESEMTLHVSSVFWRHICFMAAAFGGCF